MQKVNLTQAIPEINTETTTEIPSIYQEAGKQENEHGMDYAKTEELVRENISLDYLKKEYSPDKIEEIALLITNTLCCSAPKIRIGREWMPAGVVRSRLLKLDETHIACVLDTIGETRTKIHNIRAYLLTALYNAPSSTQTGLMARVSYDMRLRDEG